MKQITFIIILNFLAIQSLNAQETPKIKITVGTASFVLTTYDNATARGFLALLPMTITMNDVNRNEKFRPLKSNLPTSPEIPPKINVGDLMLWGAPYQFESYCSGIWAKCSFKTRSIFHITDV